ncbi:PcfJ domain-containing protein [Vagococcus fluvialis]|uniref:PcfJ-like protein n=1 Tax=Vagococcus fluvialis TaxID=2738 RepID=A0A7X6D9Y1_9ENTE|nr:PcfJ domain-containing protein [Vagococcus fluvialis]NKC68505.1 hypothetical protein [Vagococcus fluvialis]
MTTNLSKQIGKLLTPPKDFFKWCERQIPTYEWSNKEQTIKASERTDCRIIKKRLTKKSRLTFPQKFYPFAIILVSKNRIEIQSHDYWLDIKDGKEILTYRLTNFERFENGKHLKAFNNYNNEWQDEFRTNYGFMSGAYTNTRFYPNNWQEKFKHNRDMKYLKLPAIDRAELSRIYKSRLEIEYLQNIGATTMADEIINDGYLLVGESYHRRADMRVINQKWLKANKHKLKTTNPMFHVFMLEQTFRKRKAKPIKNIEYHLHFTQLNKLPKEVNLNKFQTWYMVQKESFDYYIDYLSMLEELEIPLNDTNVILPENLVKAHDNAVELINQLNLEKKAKKIEAENREYQKRLSQLKKFEKEIDEFVFLVPKELKEIIQEGSALHHCVGGNRYVKGHQKGDTNIIFIRRKEDVNKPYFTLEYKEQKVKQIQGKGGRDKVPGSIKKVVEKWEKEIKKVI